MVLSTLLTSLLPNRCRSYSPVLLMDPLVLGRLLLWLLAVAIVAPLLLRSSVAVCVCTTVGGTGCCSACPGCGVADRLCDGCAVSPVRVGPW